MDNMEEEMIVVFTAIVIIFGILAVGFQYLLESGVI